MSDSVADLAAFVDACRSAVGHGDAAERVAQAMRPVVAEPPALARAIDERRTDVGRAVIVHRSDELTILGLDVAAGFVSAPHDHRLWAVVGIYQGAEDNVFYRREPDGIRETGRAVLGEGECLALPADAVHRIANSGAGTMRGLHVYGGDLFATARSEWDDVTGEESPFGAMR